MTSDSDMCERQERLLFSWAVMNLINHSNSIWSLVVTFIFPEGEVLSKKLDNWLGISEGLLITVIKFIKGVLKSFVTKFTSLLDITHHLIMEDWEVKGKTKSDGIAGIQALLGEHISILIGLKSVSFGAGKSVVLGTLSNISAVVSNHLKEECLWFIISSLLDNISSDNGDDFITIAVQLIFNTMLVVSHVGCKLGILLVLLNCTNCADGSTLLWNEVLESNG